MKCLIVDDEPLARKGLEDYIELSPNLEHLKSLPSALEALDFIKKHKVDLMFLDIQMPDMTGLDMLEVLEHGPNVILTTAHREFALEGFEYNVVDYLLKPISYPRFLKAVNKISLDQDKFSEAVPPEDFIFIKSKGMIVKVIIDDILYVETADDYIHIHTTRETHIAPISMKQIEKELPKDKFLRVHRYYLVGLRHIKKLEGNLIYIGKSKITISRSMRNEVYKTIVGNKLLER